VTTVRTHTVKTAPEVFGFLDPIPSNLPTIEKFSWPTCRCDSVSRPLLATLFMVFLIDADLTSPLLPHIDPSLRKIICTRPLRLTMRSDQSPNLLASWRGPGPALEVAHPLGRSLTALHQGRPARCIPSAVERGGRLNHTKSPSWRFRQCILPNVGRNGLSLLSYL
jgi:hypothetical protein